MNRRQFTRHTASAVALASSLPAAIPKNSFRIWDAHCHLGRAEAPSAARAAELLKVARRMGIEKVTFCMGLTPHLANPTPAELITKNNEMMAALDAFPKETLGLVYVNPLHVGASLNEIDRCLKHPRVIGLKLWIACRCNEARLDPLVHAAEKHHATIHQHVWDKTPGNSDNESRPADLAELARRHPQTQFIAMHTGGSWENGIRALRGTPNVSAELAGSEPTSGFAEMAVRELGPDRVIWGSDAGGRSFASQLAKVIGADLTPAVKQKLLADNYRQQVERALRFKQR